MHCFSATVAENGETTATVALFCNNLTFLRQCRQAFILPCLHRVDHVTSVTSQCKYNSHRDACQLNTTTTEQQQQQQQQQWEESSNQSISIFSARHHMQSVTRVDQSKTVEIRIMRHKLTFSSEPTTNLYYLGHFKQESLVNANVSVRQPWYIGLNSLNHSSLSFFTVTPSTTNICSNKNAK